MFKEKSRLNVVRLQGGDPDCRAVWTLLCDISRAEFQKVCTLCVCMKVCFFVRMYACVCIYVCM